MGAGARRSAADCPASAGARAWLRCCQPRLWRMRPTPPHTQPTPSSQTHLKVVHCGAAVVPRLLVGANRVHLHVHGRGQGQRPTRSAAAAAWGLPACLPLAAASSGGTQHHSTPPRSASTGGLPHLKAHHLQGLEWHHNLQCARSSGGPCSGSPSIEGRGWALRPGKGSWRRHTAARQMLSFSGL